MRQTSRLVIGVVILAAAGGLSGRAQTPSPPARPAPTLPVRSTEVGWRLAPYRAGSPRGQLDPE